MSTDSAAAAEEATLVILGNGPSLKGFNFARLANVDCIGMNAAYRFWQEIDWYPRFYICLDLVVGLSHKDAIADLIRNSDQNGIELFFLRRNLIDCLREDLQESAKVVDFDRLTQGIKPLAVRPLTTGSHAALVGAYLGYRRLVLLGIDCDYVEKVAGSHDIGGALRIQETPADNPNYFFPNYQVAGDTYNVPNRQPDLHLRSWRAVAPLLKKCGVTVRNCSPVSFVDAFLFSQFDNIEAQLCESGPRPHRFAIDRGFLRNEKPPASTEDAMPGGTHARVFDAPNVLITPPAPIKSFVSWCVLCLWSRRWGVGGLASLVPLVPLTLAALVPNYGWPLIGLSILLLLSLVMALLVAFTEARAREMALQLRTMTCEMERAREQASIAFSKAAVLAKELKRSEDARTP